MNLMHSGVKRSAEWRREPAYINSKGFAHNTFKIELARRAIVRALTQAARGTPQSQSHKKIR